MINWQAEAGKIAEQDYSYTNNACIHRVNDLALKMYKNGVKPKIMAGKYRGEHHVWLEDDDGSIIDPTITSTAKEFYEPYHPMTIWELQRRIAQR